MSAIHQPSAPVVSFRIGSPVLTAEVCAHDGVKFEQRNCGQPLERRRHPRAHFRGVRPRPLKLCWGICSRASRPAPHREAPRSGSGRGSPSLRACPVGVRRLSRLGAMARIRNAKTRMTWNATSAWFT